MKKIGTLLVGVAFFSFCMLAGEVLTNDTGEDATGLRVSFSTPVLITAFGDILVSVDPQMLAFEFVFSGGVVEPWGSHWMNWAPSTAQIIEHEWTTDSFPPSTYHEGLPREELPVDAVLTYEEILAEIAQYPGDEELIYIPDIDEAIWLTDLEGHADIYDNDSIKINYADWFDKSLITMINVYRNGLTMKFIPDLFDVLTNVQMKTFDGNLLEKTPASGHTDHAIWGYEYWFDFLSEESVEQQAQYCTVVVRSPVLPKFNTPYAYIGSHWESSSAEGKLADDEIRLLLMDLKNSGFAGISVNVNCYIESVHSSDVFTLASPDGVIALWSRTASDEEIARILSLAAEQDLEAELRMQLYVSHEWASVHGGYSGSVDPHDLDRFFESYGDLARHYATLAEAYGAVLFTPFTEMDAIEQYPDRVRQFYSGLDSSFSSPFSFEESTNHYLDGFNGYSGESLFEDNVGKFWDWTSEEGNPLVVEWSCWSPTLETQADQRLSVLVEAMVNMWTPALEYYREHHPDNRIRFGEIGVYNIDGVCLGNDYYWVLRNAAAGSLFGSIDEQEVADIWAAYLIASHYMGIDGVTAWSLPLSRNWEATLNASAGCCADFGTVASGISPPLAVISSLLGGYWSVGEVPETASADSSPQTHIDYATINDPDRNGITIHLDGSLHSIHEWEGLAVITDYNGNLLVLDPPTGLYISIDAGIENVLDGSVQGSSFYYISSSGDFQRIDLNHLDTPPETLPSLSWVGPEWRFHGIEIVDDTAYVLLFDEFPQLRFEIVELSLSNKEIYSRREIRSDDGPLGEIIGLDRHDGDLYIVDYENETMYMLAADPGEDAYVVATPVRLDSYVPEGQWAGSPRGASFFASGVAFTTVGGSVHFSGHVTIDGQRLADLVTSATEESIAAAGQRLADLLNDLPSNGD